MGCPQVAEIIDRNSIFMEICVHFGPCEYHRLSVTGKGGREKNSKSYKKHSTYCSILIFPEPEVVLVEEAEVLVEGDEVVDAAALVVARCSIVSSLEEILLQVCTRTLTLVSNSVRRVFMHVLISVTCVKIKEVENRDNGIPGM